MPESMPRSRSVLRGLRVRLGSTQNTLDRPWQPTCLLGDLRLLPLDEFAGWLIAIETAEDLHRYAPVRGTAPIFEDDGEQDEASILRQLFHALGHARLIRWGVRPHQIAGQRPASSRSVVRVHRRMTNPIAA
jgi:hypothetical protein